MVCRHFGACGGCLYQDIPYEEQVARKSRELSSLFAEFHDTPVPVTPSPVQWHYRNKVDFSFARKWYEEKPAPGFERESVLGFKTRNRWFQPLEVEECLIGPEGVSALLAGVREWMRAEGLQAFDTRTKQGFLKVLLVREGKRTGQRMVVLTTAEGELNRASFVEAVRACYPADSIHWGIFRGTADVAAADEVERLYGPEVIAEELQVPDGEQTRRLRFEISPFSFFQTNTLATEILYGGIRARVREFGVRVLLDLYGGAGGIALACADLVDNIVSVENVPSATSDGLRNLALNGVDNIQFVTAKVEDYLRDVALAPDTLGAVIDPPRAGLHPKALTRLVELGPRRVLYVSCNPKILQRELPVLAERYTIDAMQGFDLFPHTPHVEVLAVMTRRA